MRLNLVGYEFESIDVFYKELDGNNRRTQGAYSCSYCVSFQYVIMNNLSRGSLHQRHRTTHVHKPDTD